jgi:hypothetical protein
MGCQGCCDFNEDFQVFLFYFPDWCLFRVLRVFEFLGYETVTWNVGEEGERTWQLLE